MPPLPSSPPADMGDHLWWIVIELPWSIIRGVLAPFIWLGDTILSISWFLLRHVIWNVLVVMLVAIWWSVSKLAQIITWALWELLINIVVPTVGLVSSALWDIPGVLWATPGALWAALVFPLQSSVSVARGVIHLLSLCISAFEPMLSAAIAVITFPFKPLMAECHPFRTIVAWAFLNSTLGSFVDYALDPRPRKSQARERESQGETLSWFQTIYKPFDNTLWLAPLLNVCLLAAALLLTLLGDVIWLLFVNYRGGILVTQQPGEWMANSSLANAAAALVPVEQITPDWLNWTTTDLRTAADWLNWTSAE